MKTTPVKSVLFIAAALGFACKIALALNTYGSNDLVTFENIVAKTKADGVLAWYRSGVDVPIPGGHGTFPQAANFPPLFVWMLRAWDYLAGISGLRLGFWLRFSCAVADIGSLLLVRSILSVSRREVRLTALLLVALSPVSIMVSGFHGNTDPIMVFFVLASVYLIASGRSPWLAGAALGLAVSVKIIALIFAPVFLFYLVGPKRRAEFTVAAAAITFALALPYVTQEPVLIVKRTLGYSSNPGIWGLTQLADIFLPSRLYAVYLTFGKLLAIVPVVWASLWMNSRKDRPALFLQCGCVAFLFLFLAPGFGIQYLAWLVPWGAALDDRAVLPYWALSGAFLFACYTALSGGFPWYLANALKGFTGYWPGVIVLCLDVACWISVGAAAYACWRSLGHAPAGQTQPRLVS